MLGNGSVNTFSWEPTDENKTSLAKQRIRKDTSLTIEVVFSAWYVQSGYKEVFSSLEQ
jgi:hypothetical protein